MICLELFWAFFKIGLFTIGGGQAMIPMITTNIVDKGWLTIEEVMDFIAIAESTPGPFAVNIATYAGMETAGVGGAVCATLGVVLPSLVIMILVAKLLSSFMKKPAVGEVFSGVRAAVTGLLVSVLITLALSTLFGISGVFDGGKISPDYAGMAMFALVCPIAFVKIKGKRLHPFFLIILCAALGVLVYGLLDHFGIST